MRHCPELPSLLKMRRSRLFWSPGRHNKANLVYTASNTMASCNAWACSFVYFKITIFSRERQEASESRSIPCYRCIVVTTIFLHTTYTHVRRRTPAQVRGTLIPSTNHPYGWCIRDACMPCMCDACMPMTSDESSSKRDDRQSLDAFIIK